MCGGDAVGDPSAGHLESEHAHVFTELLLLYTSACCKEHGVVIKVYVIYIGPGSNITHTTTTVGRRGGS